MRDVTSTWLRFEADRPLPTGTWHWWVMASCAHGPTSPSDRRSFVVVVDPDAATPTVTASITSTATATPTKTPWPVQTVAPAYLPFVARLATAAGN